MLYELDLTFLFKYASIFGYLQYSFMANFELKNRIKTAWEDETQGAIFLIVLVSLFCLVNIFGYFSWTLYLPSMIFGFIISAKNPRSGLYALIFLTIVFEKFFTLKSLELFGTEIKLYPLDIIFCGSLFGMFWNHAFSKNKILIGRPEKLLGIFMLINIFYLFFAYLQNSDLALSFSTFKNYVFYPLFYLMIYSLIKDKQKIKKMFQFYLAGAISIIIFFLIGLIRQRGIWTEFTPLSTEGVRLLAFSHGLFISLAFIPTFLFLSVADKKDRWWIVSLLIIWVCGIFGTLMRHLWISIFVSFVIIFLICAWKVKKSIVKIGIKLLIPIILIILIINFYPQIVSEFKNQESEISELEMVVERVQSISDGKEDSSFYWRSVAWKAGIEKFKESPIFGIGTGKRVIVEMKWLTQNVEVRSIHNSYLSILIQFGLIGLIIFCSFILSLLGGLWKLRQNFSALVVLSAILFFLSALVFQPYLETNFLALFFWIALGLARALPQIEKDNS